ncbi:MAG: hypothetical protein DI628_01350 [Blastochloris viridis]|uniref:Uncharacterized protein n=1 Tax=Blastochloris viridis TaxID=1079 RepID=A0A6N4RBB1_BLAVI|nr:MAG: hypothetical protein DI628_01350 [Blastochloris viridis]
MWRVLALTVLVAGLLPVAWGQAQSQSKAVTEIETVIAAQKDKVGAILLQQQRSLADGCGTLAILMPSAVTVYEPLQMQSGKPVKGSWQVRYAVDACGMAQLRNIAMDVVNGNIALAEMVPGDTLTDRALQKDVLKSFDMAAEVAMPKCVGNPVIRETRVQIHPNGADDVWQELWIGRMCGRDVGQIVKFMPNAKGTTFRMSLPKATLAK